MRLDAGGVPHPDHVMHDAAERLLTELRLLGDALTPFRKTIEVEDDVAKLAS